MIDFDALVLAPTMAVFAIPITVTPVKSQPGQPAYAARGVLKIENIDMALQEGIASVQVITLGVRLSEFAVAPGPEDRVTTATDAYAIDDTDDDGQGGSTWTLKRLNA